MKKLFFIAAVFLCSASMAQGLKITTDGVPIGVSKVVKLDSSMTQGQLYILGKEWLINVFNNPKFVLQMEDKDAGIIVGKCKLSHLDTLGTARSGPMYQTMVIDYMIKLSFKNGEIKYEVSNFVTEAGLAINDGKITVENLPSVGLLSKKKLVDYYTRSYVNDQSSCNLECESISKSIEGFFQKKQPGSN